MTTKPLIERLSKENFDKLMNCEFTNLRTFITKSLETNKFWSDLTLEDAVILHTTILDLGYFDLNTFIKLFEDGKDTTQA